MPARLLLAALIAAAVGIASFGTARAAKPVGLKRASTTSATKPQPADLALDAREALRVRDTARLAALRDEAVAKGHPLAAWIDYWEIGTRLAQVQQSDLEAFYARWPGSYVEDRLRNDWLLELGRRRDWANLAREVPRFRMADDREVACWALAAEYAALSGRAPDPAFKARALDAWRAQRDADEGCQHLAATLAEARLITSAEAWQRARLAVEANRARQVRAAAALAAPALAAQVASALDKPALYLNAGATVATRAHAEVAAIALARMAAGEPEVAATQMQDKWRARLPRDLAAWTWAQIGRQAAFKLMPEAASWYRNAWADAERAAGGTDGQPDWSDETFAWAARAALRDNASPPGERWLATVRAIDHMSPTEQRDSAWRYWRARAQRETAAPGGAGDRARAQALAELRTLAGELHFYGKLAAEDLGQPFVVPPRPQPLAAAEREDARAHPGLTRALLLIGLGLRGEGVREWNFSLRGMGDRALLAAADRACAAEVWDRCINTSERTKVEVDYEQRFPMPWRAELVRHAAQVGLDAAYVFGLIRQESRFIADARSGVGASGLMQVMPATARWTAQRIGLPFTQDMINEREVNLKIGTAYLKLVLDDFGGSQALAAAAYNAGPSRPRRWREGAILDPAVWAETIPFNETRDYVKKVLSNATVYSLLLAGQRQPPPAPPRPTGLHAVGTAEPAAVVVLAASGAASGAASAAEAGPATVDAATNAAASSVGATAAGSASAPGAVVVPIAAATTPAITLPSLKARLGGPIGPREASAPPPDKELP